MRIELTPAGPQPAALPLSYDHMSKTAQTKKLEWDRFLEELSADKTYPELQRAQVQETWKHIMELVPDVTLPSVRYEERKIIFSWVKPPLSIEIEFLSDHSIEWFFSDSGTHHYAGSSAEEEPCSELSKECFTLLKLFSKKNLN